MLNQLIGTLELIPTLYIVVLFAFVLILGEIVVALCKDECSLDKNLVYNKRIAEDRLTEHARAVDPAVC